MISSKKFLLFRKILRFAILVFLIYLILAPFIPEIAYRLRDLFGLKYKDENIFVIDEEKEDWGDGKKDIPEREVEGNRLVIPTIGVNVAVVEGNDESALSRGVWRRPKSSTPDVGGNTVITGHRFQYMPPNNKTFYNLNKVKKDAKIFLYWKGKEYIYIVSDIFIVEPEQVEIEANTQENILTLYTCHPLWTADKRYVVRGELLE
jgi:LPXTG-site transpeptidase (sortase) family protein